METEEREQPISEPANALNVADENSVASDDGSQDISFGKFKTSKALLDAYNNLQAEFTKKCQQLSAIKKDKMNENSENLIENNEKSVQNDENLSNFDEKEENIDNENINENQLKKDFNSFLGYMGEAENYFDEIKSQLQNKNQSPFEKAWAGVILSHIKNTENKQDDPIINQYILSDENVKNKIIEDYLEKLDASKPPVVMSSRLGEKLSSVQPDKPKSLKEAKDMVNKMFS